MFVVHGVWLRAEQGTTPGRLALWAEVSTATPAEKRRGRPPRIRPHPFAAPAALLTDLLTPAAPAEAPAPAAAPGAGLGPPAEVTLTLPTRDAAPLASPQLVRDDLTMSSGALSDAPWLVPVIELAPGAALSVLRRMGAVDAALGASLPHLIGTAAFAADLVARGRLLPGLQLDPEPGRPARAVWRPVLTGADASWARALAVSMPPPVAAADPGAPLAVWAHALDDLVDATARAALRAGRWATPARIGDETTRAWLAALAGDDARIAGVAHAEAAAAGLAALDRAIATWQRDAVAGPVRALFRLVEPGDDHAWSVDFALQATDEPSLVVDADAVWRARGPLPALARHLDSPQETFLAELGKAGRVYPELDTALASATPVGLPLDTAGAHRFLSVAAPALATAGFGVQLPGWWSNPTARLGIRLTAKTPAQPGRVDGGRSTVGFGSIAEFRHDLAVGGEVLTENELAELVARKAPMVRLRGQWIELDARRLAAGMKLVGRTGTATIGELLQLGLGQAQAADALPVESVQADGWLGDLLSGQSELRLTPVTVPDSFDGDLRPYQLRGLSWLDFMQRAGLGGVLADDMGLGKTVQLLALLAHDPVSGPSLLICPMSLVGNWQREAARFTPSLRVHVHHGTDRARGAEFAAAVAGADLVVTTYSLAARDAAQLRKTTWNRIVVDEAQAIKNAATKQSTAIRSLPAATRIAVTGTPVENRLADLWSILEFANPGLLGTAAAFKKAYAEPIERHGDDVAAERLRRFTGPFILRRLKTDRSVISDLPEKLEMDVLCNLTSEQAALYQAVVDDMLHRIESTEGIERRGLVLATMTKLKQVCNHPAHFLRDGSALTGRSGKLERVDEIVDEVLDVDEKVLLFTQYTEFGSMLRAHLAGRTGREVVFLHGSVPKPARDAMVARFQEGGAGSAPVFVLSLKAGGTGLTLTAANHVVHVDRWWNPAVEDQATDRAFRIGQRRAVQVRKLVCTGTIEEKIAEMIRNKRGLAAKIVGSGEGWLTELSTGQLRELFRLEADAVVE